MGHDTTRCLSHCRVVDAQDMRNTNNGLHLLALECGRVAVFRPHALEIQSTYPTDIKPGNYFQKEAVASLISNIGEFNFVPTTVVRTLRTHVGCVQEHIEKGRDSLKEVLTPYKHAELAAFDYVLGNAHRHKDHYIIDKNRCIWIVNASLSMHYEDITWDGSSMFFDDAVAKSLIIPDLIKKIYREKFSKIASTVFSCNLPEPFDTAFWIRRRILHLVAARTFADLPVMRSEVVTA